MTPAILTPAEARDYLAEHGVDWPVSRVRGWCDAGLLPSIRKGRP